MCFLTHNLGDVEWKQRHVQLEEDSAESIDDGEEGVVLLPSLGRGEALRCRSELANSEWKPCSSATICDRSSTCSATRAEEGQVSPRDEKQHCVRDVLPAA